MLVRLIVASRLALAPRTRASSLVARGGGQQPQPLWNKTPPRRPLSAAHRVVRQRNMAGVVFASQANRRDLDAVEREVRGERAASELARKVESADKFKLSPVDAKVLQGMLDELGINTPGQLRGYITKRSLPALAASVLETLLSGVGAAASLYIWAVLPWDALILMERGVWPWAAAALTGFGQGVALFSGAMFTASALFSTVTLFATLYATLAFDVNARGFMNSVARRSGGIGIGAFEAGPRAAASLDVLKKLTQMREMLMFRAAQRATAPPSGSLAVHLAALADMQSGGRGLGLAALALAPSEAATLARLFARFDADGDDKLDVGELRAMMAELTPDKNVSLEAATAALHLLDVDGDGLVELDEFAAWYGSFRLMHQRSEQLEQGGDGGGPQAQEEQMKVEEKQEKKEV